MIDSRHRPPMGRSEARPTLSSDGSQVTGTDDTVEDPLPRASTRRHAHHHGRRRTVGGRFHDTERGVDADVATPALVRTTEGTNRGLVGRAHDARSMKPETAGPCVLVTAHGSPPRDVLRGRYGRAHASIARVEPTRSLEKPAFADRGTEHPAIRGRGTEERALFSSESRNGAGAPSADFRMHMATCASGRLHHHRRRRSRAHA